MFSTSLILLAVKAVAVAAQIYSAHGRYLLKFDEYLFKCGVQVAVVVEAVDQPVAVLVTRVQPEGLHNLLCVLHRENNIVCRQDLAVPDLLMAEWAVGAAVPECALLVQ